MSVDSLQQQITSAVGRLNLLQRRVEGFSPEPPKVLRQALGELETLVETLRVAQEQLVESRSLLETARQALQRERNRYWELFDSAPDAYLVTGSQSEILEANKAAAELLNISQRFLTGKVLSVFIADERARFTTESTHLAQQGGTADWMLRLRPRERAPIEIAARATAATGDGTLRWLLRPVNGRPHAQRTTEP